jgi:4-amino-4-deoxy-L-arabinose transferase-like glycosyltransferase
MLENRPLAKSGWLQSRWPMALIGLILLIVGQIQISNSKVPSSPPTQVGQWLNSTLHLDIPSIDNIINGLPILLMGGILLAIALRGLKLLPMEGEAEEKIPFAFHQLTSSWPGIICAFALLGTAFWSLARREYSPWMAIGWMIGLLILIGVIATWDQQREVDLSPGLKRQDILWILGLAFIGLLVGTFRLQGLPDSLTTNESYFWATARDIANGVFKPSALGLGINGVPFLGSYLQAEALKLFGINFWGWRFSSVLSGTFALVPLYLFAREAFGRKVAVVSSLALIASPFFLAFSRLGYINILALFLTALAMYWLYLGFIRDSHLYLFLAGCVSGLGAYTYFSTQIVVLIGVAFIGVLWLSRKMIFSKVAFATFLLCIGILLVIGPFLIYGSNHNDGWIGYKSFEGAFFNSLNGRLLYSEQELFAVAPPIDFKGYTLFFDPKIYLEMLIRGLTRTLMAFQKSGLLTENFISSSFTGTIGAFFYLIGLGWALWKFKQPRNLLLILWFLGAAFFLSALYITPPYETYLVSIIPALSILTGLGLCAIVSAIGTAHAQLSKHNNIFLAIALVVLGFGGLLCYCTGPIYPAARPDHVLGSLVCTG